MHDIVKNLHSYWAYIVLIVLVIAVVNSIYKRFTEKEYQAIDFRISLFTLIVSHIQLLIGLVLYFVSPRLSLFSDPGMGEIMKNAVDRLYLIEHPIVNILAVVCITIGYSKHKKRLTSTPKFNSIAIYYTLGLVLLLSRIPWSAWMS